MYMVGAGIALAASGCGSDTASAPPTTSFRENVPTVSAEPGKKTEKPVLKNRQVRGFSVPKSDKP
jgi:hypothetical protein